MNTQIKTVADVKRLPVGTRLKIINSLIGPPKPGVDPYRTVGQVRSADIIMLKTDGTKSYLTLRGCRVEARPNGFAIFEADYRDEKGPKNVLCAEYVFVEEEQ